MTHDILVTVALIAAILVVALVAGGTYYLWATEIDTVLGGDPDTLVDELSGADFDAEHDDPGDDAASRDQRRQVMTGFTRGQRVRIVEHPTSISGRQAGREGEYLGQAYSCGRKLFDTVTVLIDSGLPAYDTQVTLSPRDLEPVA